MRKKRWIPAALLLSAAAFAAAVLCAASRSAPAGGTIKLPGEGFHERTRWSVAPDYDYDALCLFNLVSGNDYITPLYEGTPEGAFAQRLAAGLNPSERRSVRRLAFVFGRLFGTVPSSALVNLYHISGAKGIGELAEMLREPAAFRKKHAAAFGAFFGARLEWLSPPGFLVDFLLEDIAVYLEAVERSGFREFWTGSVYPELRVRADALEAELGAYDIIPEVERLLGLPLPDDRVDMILCRFARPNGISLGENSFIMEERAEGAAFARVAVHELLHGWVDWNSGPALERLTASVMEDPRVRAAFRRRNRDYGYNSAAALVEEALVKALDQVGSERLGIDEPWRERFFFSDDGLHAAGLGLYCLFSAGEIPLPGDSGMTLQETMEQAAASGVLRPGRIAELWNDAYGLDREGLLPEQRTVSAVYRAGDPALDAIHPSYNRAMDPGTAIVFIDDWLVAGSPEESLNILNAAAHPPLPGWEYLFAGNWSTERDGRQYFYRNAFYFRLPKESD